MTRVAGGATLTSAQTADGVDLRVRTWLPPQGTPRAGSLLLVHGVGEHSGRYDHVAAAITSLGIVVQSWDQRGFGASGGPRGTIPHPNALLEDLAFMFARFASEMVAGGVPGRPFLLGHSMGGGLVARAVTAGQVVPRGMLLSSPAMVPRIIWLERMAAIVGDRVAPSLRTPHRLPLAKVSRDPAVYAAIRADRLAHDRVTPRLVAFMLRAGAAAIEDAPRCTVPTLIQVAGDDHLVRPEGALEFAERLPAGVGTVHLYEGLYHEIFNELPDDRARVLGDLQEWLSARLSASS